MGERTRQFLGAGSKRFPAPQRRWQAALLLAVAAGLGWAAPARSAQEAAPPADGQFRYDSKSRRDPFSPLVRDGRMVGVMQTHTIQTSRPVLYGILWDAGGQSIALINDIEVKVGDTVGTYRVVEIRKDAVVLSDGREPVVLQLAFEPVAPGQAPAP